MSREETGGAADPLLRRVARGGAVNLVGAVAGAVLNTLLVIAVTRGFDQRTAGILFAATSVFLIAAAVANLGTSNGIVYFVARLRAMGAAGQVKRVLRLALGPVTVVSAVAGAAMFAFAGEVAALIGSPDARAYVRILAVFLPFAVFTDAALAATRAFHDMRATALVDRVGRPLAQLALVGGVALTGSVGLLTIAWAGPYLPAAVLVAVWLRAIISRAPSSVDLGDIGEKTGPDTPLSPRSTGRGEGVTAREFWGFSLPRSVASIAQLGNQRLGIVLVAALQGAVEAAVFTAATRFIAVGQFTTQAIQLAAQPRLAELLAVDDRRGATALYQSATVWLICLTWPLFLPVIVYAPLVMGLFGDAYVAGADVLAVICAAQLTAAALGMGDLVLTMAGRTAWNLVDNLLALAANVALCLVLVPHMGAVGAAAGWLAAIAVRKVLPLLQLAVALGLHPFSRRWLMAVAVCLVWFGGVPLACAATLGTGWVSLTVALGIGCAGYLPTLWRLRGVLEPATRGAQPLAGAGFPRPRIPKR
ncbi:lipopolysaccharide biosynthesis protein [Nocardiopsis gilva]|uniref:lipopolysaccharide biosynthesis protein n=1 Tax=Nocardiopsis gilva TaxID=280236 RepID=UPI001E658557|nr:polysaccharide biosynthesis C-terminal domain-containing protein [Nocardiopsis gilva]